MRAGWMVVVLVGAAAGCGASQPPYERSTLVGRDAPLPTDVYHVPLYASAGDPSQRPPLVARVGPPSVTASEADQIRGLIYRVDGEAHAARLHPNESRERSMAAARYAEEAAAKLQNRPSLRPAADELLQAAESLADASRRENPVDVQDRAADVQIYVRQLDEALPPPGTVP